jgi:hypothetical protein
MKKSFILLLSILILVTLLPVHQVFAQDSAWSEVIDSNGNILYDHLSDQGVVTQAADWMPNITLPVVGTVSVPAEYHSYVTESGNTVLMPTASTLFFMAASANESGFLNAASTMGTSGLSTVNSDSGNVVGFASLGAFFGAMTGNQDIGLPSNTNSTDFFNQVISGQTDIWSLNPAGLMNFLTSLSEPSLADGNLYTYMLLYAPGQCGSTPAGCSAVQLDLLASIAPTPLPPTSVATPPLSKPICPSPSVRPGAISASASQVAPPYPLVVGQDPAKRGVDVEFSASVAPTIYTYYTTVPIYEEQCKTVLGVEKCSKVITSYSCKVHTISYPECIASASASMSLSKDSRDWILNELSIRYPEAYLHHPDFSFSGGGCAFSVSKDHVQVADPGNWNVRLSGSTSGTPVSAPRSFSRVSVFSAWLKEVVIIK